MSDMHVLAGDGSEFQVVMHFAVPSGNNAVSVSWADALVNSGVGGTTQLTEGAGAGQIDATEKAAIEAGTVFEFIVVVPGLGEGTTASRILLLQERYAAYKSAKITKLQDVFRFFGHTESEA